MEKYNTKYTGYYSAHKISSRIDAQGRDLEEGISFTLIVSPFL
jgi:hypothetical protein